MRHSAPRHLSPLTVLAGSLALVAATLPGQAGTEAPKIQHDATSLTLPAGDLPLKDVVDATATFLKVNILYDGAEVQAQGGTIALQTPMTITRDKAEAAVSDLVYANGFVLAPRDLEKGLYNLVFLRGPKAREAMQMAPHRTVEQVLSQPTLKQPVATSFTLQNTNATIATNAMRPFFASTGSAPTGVTFGTADNRTMLISGIQCEVVKAIEMLRKVDVRSDDPALGGAPTSHATDKELQQRVAELEQAVERLQKELAELKQRVGAGK